MTARGFDLSTLDGLRARTDAIAVGRNGLSCVPSSRSETLGRGGNVSASCPPWGFHVNGANRNSSRRRCIIRVQRTASRIDLSDCAMPSARPAARLTYQRRRPPHVEDLLDDRHGLLRRPGTLVCAWFERGTNFAISSSTATLTSQLLGTRGFRADTGHAFGRVLRSDKDRPNHRRL